MGLRRTIMAVGVGAALAYFFDPVSGAERRERVQKTVEEQLNKRTGQLTGDRSSVQTRSVPTSPE